MPSRKFKRTCKKTLLKRENHLSLAADGTDARSLGIEQFDFLASLTPGISPVKIQG